MENCGNVRIKMDITIRGDPHQDRDLIDIPARAIRPKDPNPKDPKAAKDIVIFHHQKTRTVTFFF
jgi:hypothetical protein